MIAPYLFSNVVAGLIWLLLLDPLIGMTNVFLDAIGLPEQRFLASPDTAMISVAGINIWRHVGFTALRFYAGLQAIPRDLYEAARLDGAREWQMFRTFTLPLLRPVMVFVLVTSVIGSFQIFVTESSEPFAEYVPWYIKSHRPDLIRKFNIPLDEYPRRCEARIAGWQSMSADLKDPSKPIEVRRSPEYGSEIIHSVWTGTPRVIYGNMRNNGAITNLPADACVEVPCLVDRQGVQPTAVGEIPLQLACPMQTQINVQKLTVEAVLTGRRDHVLHAALLDPHTAAELDTQEIADLVDRPLDAPGAFIPDALRAA
jgi:alpha-galactosidase/6-phospho-beta-glucosidase family protein